MWDSQNRLVSCTSGGVTSTYTYGADGLRRTSTVNGVTTYYVYDGSMMVQEMKQNAQGQLQATATYLCGPRGPEYRRDDTQAEGTYTDASGTQYPAGKTRWYVYDGLGSVVGEVDPSGNLTSSGTFDVYGAKRQGGTGAATSRQGFVGSLGHVTDSETGLVYMRARYYDPNVGRFVSEDPAGQGINWFIYCSNNPVNRVDTTGKDGYDVAGSAIKLLYQFLGSEYHFGFPGNTPPGNLASILRYLDARINVLLGRGVTEVGVGAAEIKDDQSESDIDNGAQEIEGGNSAEDGARKVAEAEELRAIVDFISEGCPNDSGF